MRSPRHAPTACSALLFALPLLAAGCLAEVDDDLDVVEEEEHDLELRTGTAPLPAEGTPLAYGMLRVANELSFTQLDVDVALDRRAAVSIAQYRAHTDTVLGSADDLYVDTVGTLDSLYWLGPAQLTKIQTYAINNGYVPAAVPTPACEPELDEAIRACLRFVELAATPEPSWGSLGWGPFAADLVPSCLEASTAAHPSAAFFASAGLPGYLDPVLGYQGLSCGAAPAPMCALGVAGIADHVLPECDALYAVAPALTEHAVDPVMAADWAAAIAALDAASYDSSHHLRVYEHAPGMAPTLLGDVMGDVLASAPIEYGGPWLERLPSDALPPLSAGAQALLSDVIADLGLTGAAFDVASASEEVACHNCHTFHDGWVLLFRDARIVVVLDVETFWDS
jgi:hypothetical protein